MELEQRFSSEEACREYLAALRWPEFACGAVVLINVHNMPMLIMVLLIIGGRRYMNLPK